MSSYHKWMFSSICLSCSNKILRNFQPYRSFSMTPKMGGQVRMRREMFQWMSRVGKNLREPLKDSTNYLSAYAINGSLKRVAERFEAHTRKVERIRELARKSPEKEEEFERELNQIEDEYSLESKTLPNASRRDMMPFPANKDFISEPVLGPWLQKQIWLDVMVNNMTVREVSAQRGVEMSRVAAVVRLLEVEKELREQGKETADEYTNAVMEMLPYTGKTALLKWSEEDDQILNEARFKAKSDAQREIRDRDDENARREAANLPILPRAEPEIPDDLELKRRIIENRRRAPHESINDLPALKKTGPQIWLPVSESRRFTRADAAKVFDERLQPPDKQVPHPELSLMHKEWLAGKTLEERTELQQCRGELERQKIAHRIEKKALREKLVKKVENKRGVVFRFQEIKVDDAGKNGRGIKGVGWRYGVPNTYRSKGDVKIPLHALVPPRHMPAIKFKSLQNA